MGLIDTLKMVEWSARYSYCAGWPSCPVCHGIKPGHGADEAGKLPLNQGHKPGCALADELAYLSSNAGHTP